MFSTECDAHTSLVTIFAQRIGIFPWRSGRLQTLGTSGGSKGYALFVQADHHAPPTWTTSTTLVNFDAMAPTTLWTPRHLTENDIRSGNPKPSQETETKIRKYLEITGRYTGSLTPQDDVARPENNGGVSVKTFIPSQASTGNLNNHSVVTVLEYSGVKILIPGDNEPPSWDELLNRRDFVTAIAGTHVLVASHHGRESGFHSPLFDHFHPLITLISDGRVVDTSATARYTNVTQGRPVSRRNRTTQDRKCVTTRNDGHIEVAVDVNSAGQGTLGVTID